MLPEQKTGLPKCLYLDQNKWIDLSRAHYGRDEGEPYLDALEATRNSVARGTLVVPFSIVHSLETLIAGDPGRRERLARFMVDLSGNRTILPYMATRPMEVRNALLELFGRGLGTPVRPTVIQEGIAAAFGCVLDISGAPSAVRETVRAFVNSPEGSVQALLWLANNREFFRTMVASEEVAAGDFERIRERAQADLTTAQRRALEVQGLLTSTESAGRDLLRALDELGIRQQELLDRWATADGMVRFAQRVPTLDVLVALLIERDRSRAVQRNDIRDMVWLSVALPYADIIVMERSWADLVRRAGLDTAYRTTILTDTADLPAALNTLGCLGEGGGGTAASPSA